MKSFFARTVDSGGFLGERDFGVVKYMPNKGAEKVSPVLFLTGKKIDAPGMKDPTGEEKTQRAETARSGKKAKAPPAPPSFSLRGQAGGDRPGPGEPGLLRPQHRQSHGASLSWAAAW